ncbi:MAG: hypothetical protein EOP11_19595, partial [Proteobacteria bacterium]
MKTFALFLFATLFLPSFAGAASFNAAETPASLEVVLKKSKLRYDAASAGNLQAFAACREPGYTCRSSGECCGSSFCRDNVCSDSGNSCRGPGAACRSSGECCGSSFCRDGYCGDNGNSCRQEGARCR